MKLFSRMLTRKPTEEEALGKVDLDMDVEPLRKRDDEGMADDSGQVNPTRVRSSRAQTEVGSPFDAVTSEPITPRAEEPEEADGAGWGDNAFAAEEDWEDDEDWGQDEDLTAGIGADESEDLVHDIRGAVTSVSHVEPEDVGAPVSSATGSAQAQKDWANDEEFGRRAIARSRIGSQVEGAEDRLMSETNSKFTDTESTRRRSALAHLKRAAAATKADKVLSHVAKRDPTLDPDEQSPYRDDLAKVVRPRSGSRPISRPVSKGQTMEEPWDAGTSDEDAAMFAAASEQSLMADGGADDVTEDDSFDPLAHVPDNLSAEDFAGGAEDEPEDEVFTGNYHDDYDADGIEKTPISRASVAGSRIVDPFEAEVAEKTNLLAEGVDENDDKAFMPDEEEDFDGPVPSTAVSDAIAIANGEMELEDDDEDDADNAAVRSQLEGFGGDVSKVVETTGQIAEPEKFVNVASAISTAGRSGRSAGRVKTRLLGFQPGDEAEKDIFEATKEKVGPNATDFPVGWIIVVEGPGRGKCFTLYNGASSIGRGEDQSVRLDFGDNSISRNNHAAVAFDDEEGKFFLGHGGKSNLVRLNGKPVLSTEELSKGDEIRIGETTLRFMPLCGDDFTWNDAGTTETDNELGTDE